MAKVLLKLHQPYKWKKHNYITDDDYAKAEHMIYNNLSMKTYLEEVMPQSDDSWIPEVMKDDETFDYLEGDKDNYVITTYGRIFNVTRKKSVMPSAVGTNIMATLKGQTVNYKKEFNRLGWIYSFTFIMDKYKEYNWRIYQGYQVKD